MPLAYGTKNDVKPNTETTIISYDVPANKVVKLDGFIAFGDCAAIYRLYVGDSCKASYMTSEADRTAYVVFRTEHVSGAVAIAIKVVHFTPLSKMEQGRKFEGTILGA